MTDFREEVKNSLAVLNQGGIIIYPTDTLWAIGCDATSATAVEKLCKLLKRPMTTHMTVLVDNDARLQQYISEVPSLAFELMDLTIKPLTIVYEKPRYVADNLIAPDNTLAVRVCKEPYVINLLQQFKRPIVGTIACFHNSKVPKSFTDIDKDLIQLADYVVRYRQHDKITAKQSGLMMLKNNGEIKVIRE